MAEAMPSHGSCARKLRRSHTRDGSENNNAGVLSTSSSTSLGASAKQGRLFDLKMFACERLAALRMTSQERSTAADERVRATPAKSVKWSIWRNSVKGCLGYELGYVEAKTANILVVKVA